uniref:ILEI/PANDER domain-containing protein n=1 Tax=Lates calcarifer TaxID=8187 RepID=A0A4W6BKV2_LATCA
MLQDQYDKAGSSFYLSLRSTADSKNCPGDHFSFLIRSGAANVVPPKICIQNNLVLGGVINNAGYGINVVILNGKTGEVIKTGHFDMYSGKVKPLIELLKSIEKGSIVLMASYDEPSSKLTEDARKLIAELGSSVVQSLGFRDNWVFVGGKGATVKSNFEKYLKNDNMKNKYENWPELIELTGCIPKYLD